MDRPSRSGQFSRHREGDGRRRGDGQGAGARADTCAVHRSGEAAAVPQSGLLRAQARQGCAAAGGGAYRHERGLRHGGPAHRGDPRRLARRRPLLPRHAQGGHRRRATALRVAEGSGEGRQRDQGALPIHRDADRRQFPGQEGRRLAAQRGAALLHPARQRQAKAAVAAFSAHRVAGGEGAGGTRRPARARGWLQEAPRMAGGTEAPRRQGESSQAWTRGSRSP